MTIGIRKLGTTALGTWRVAAGPEIGIRVTIGGTRIAYMPKAFEITHDITGRGTAKFQFDDIAPFPLQSVRPGSPVSITRQLTGETLFRGRVSDLNTIDFKFESIDDPQRVRYDIKANDWNSLPDRALILDSLPDGLTVKEAVDKLIFESSFLGREGVTTSGVVDDDELVLPPLRFDRDTLREALDKISRLYDLVWWIDYGKILHMAPLCDCMSSVNFGSGAGRSGAFSDLRKFETIRDYRNSQWIGGGKDRTSQKQEVREGDGDKREFETRYEIAEKPMIEIDTGSGYVEVDPDRIGDQEKDDDEAVDENGNPLYEWFWREGQAEVTQNRDVDVLDEGDTIRITYIGLFPILTLISNANEQRARAQIEGGTGIYEASQDERSLNDTEAAEDLAEGLLKRFGAVGQRITLQTLVKGFRVGFTMDVNFPAFGVSGFFVITRIRQKEIRSDHSVTNGLLMNDLTLEKIARPRSFFEFWRDATRTGARDFTESGNSKLLFGKFGVETIGAYEAVATAVTGDSLDDSTDDVSTVPIQGVMRQGLARASTFRHLT